MSNSNNSIAPVLSDKVLVKQWPGFTSNHTQVNGVDLHYVDGGNGPVLVCLPGWPQTWFSYSNIAPALAEKFRVIVVDIRGMGSSEKPAHGYDKKTMAGDIAALLQHLGIDKATVLGHDIGGMVAVSMAHNYPQQVAKLVVMDGLHPNEGMMHMPLLPAAGTFGEKMDGNQPYPWWMSFNQVKDLPEKLLVGRFRFLLDYLFHYVMIDDQKMSSLERDLYEAHYDRIESIRAANAWYQTFEQDIEDAKQYGQLELPVLGIASYVSSKMMSMALPMMAKNVQVVVVEDSGHYLFEEQPERVLGALHDFL